MLKRLFRKLFRKIEFLYVDILCYYSRKLKNFIIDFIFDNSLNKKADSIAEYNMTLKARKLKKQRRKLSLFYQFCFLFCFCSILLFYDVADEDQFLFIYEFHKWW